MTSQTCNLDQEIDSENEAYIKRCCREKIAISGTFLLLIGEDTRFKYKYVTWEAEVAIEKGCRLIGVNINKANGYDPYRCPSVLNNVGALFVPFGIEPVRTAIEGFVKQSTGNHYYSRFADLK